MSGVRSIVDNGAYRRIAAGFLGLTLGFAVTDFAMDRHSAASPARFAAISETHTAIDEPDVYFPNCGAARAAGAAPLRHGRPGYDGHLDRDSDGVACE